MRLSVPPITLARPYGATPSPLGLFGDGDRAGIKLASRSRRARSTSATVREIGLRNDGEECFAIDVFDHVGAKRR
jgi:hypothetical protein